MEVTLVDANHCPGAAQLLFALPDGSRYVHCGDMRYAPHLLASPALQRFRGPSALYLDTTYCNPRYTFPPQEQSVQYVADTIAQLMEQPVEEEGHQVEQGQGQGQGQEQQGQEQQGQGQEQQGQEQQGQGQEQQGQEQQGQEQQGQGQEQQGQQEEGQQQELCAEPGVEGAGPAGCQAGSAAADCEVPAAGGAHHAQLFLISTYVIGKERILLAVAQSCGCKVGRAPAAAGACNAAESISTR